MDQNSQNDGKIIPFNSGFFEQIDYTKENPDDWSFEEEFEKSEVDLKNENCGKVKRMDIDSNKF